MGRLPCNSSLPLGPTTNNGHPKAVALAMPTGAAHPVRGPWELEVPGQQLGPPQEPASSIPAQRTLTSAPAGSRHGEPGFTHTPRRGIPLPTVALLPLGKGRLGKSNPSTRPLPWVGESQPKDDARGSSFCWFLYSGTAHREGGGREPRLRPGFRLEALGLFQGC